MPADTSSMRRHTDQDLRLELLKSHAHARFKVRELVLMRRDYSDDSIGAGRMRSFLDETIQFWRKAARNWKAEIMAQ